MTPAFSSNIWVSLAKKSTLLFLGNFAKFPLHKSLISQLLKTINKIKNAFISQFKDLTNLIKITLKFIGFIFENFACLHQVEKIELSAFQSVTNAHLGK